jgi:hypothetical protein
MADYYRYSKLIAACTLFRTTQSKKNLELVILEATCASAMHCPRVSKNETVTDILDSMLNGIRFQFEPTAHLMNLICGRVGISDKCKSSMDVAYWFSTRLVHNVNQIAKMKFNLKVAQYGSGTCSCYECSCRGEAKVVGHVEIDDPFSIISMLMYRFSMESPVIFIKWLLKLGYSPSEVILAPMPQSSGMPQNPTVLNFILKYEWSNAYMYIPHYCINTYDYMKLAIHCLYFFKCKKIPLTEDWIIALVDYYKINMVQYFIPQDDLDYAPIIKLHLNCNTKSIYRLVNKWMKKIEEARVKNGPQVTPTIQDNSEEFDDTSGELADINTYESARDIVPEQVIVEPIVPEQVIVEPIVPEQVIVEPIVPEQVIVEPIVPEQVIVEPIVPIDRVQLLVGVLMRVLANPNIPDDVKQDIEHTFNKYKKG